MPDAKGPDVKIAELNSDKNVDYELSSENVPKDVKIQDFLVTKKKEKDSKEPCNKQVDMQLVVFVLEECRDLSVRTVL